jgi:hypothetical protein
MTRRPARAAASMLLILAVVAFAGDAAAQGAKSLVGTWTIVTTDTIDESGKRTPTFGPNPRGLLVFTADGRYSLILARTTLPKFTSNNRNTGTPSENQTIVAGSLAHFGKYTADDKKFTFQVETCTFPNWDGTTQERPYTVTSEELKYSTAAASGGGRAELVWRRVK